MDWPITKNRQCLAAVSQKMHGDCLGKRAIIEELT